MTHFRTIALFAALCLLMADTVNAQTDDFPSPDPPFKFFSTSDTFTTPMPDDSVGIVGYSGDDGNDDDNFIGATAVTLTWTTKGIFLGDVYVYNGSTVIVTGGDPADPKNNPGGALGNSVFLNDTSSAIVSGQGEVTDLRAKDHSTVTVSGGLIGLPTISPPGDDGDLWMFDSSTATISGGTIDQVNAFDNSTVNISGGTLGIINGTNSGDTTTSNAVITASGSSLNVGSVSLSQGATMTISGGTYGSVSVFDGSSVNVTQGTITGQLSAIAGFGGPSTGATLDGATVGSLGVEGGATSAAILIMDSGAVTGSATAQSGGIMILSGGTIAGSVTASSNGSISLSGSISVTGDVSESSALVTFDSGANVGGGLFATDGQITMNGGSVSNSVSASSSSIVTLAGGTVGGAVGAQNSSTVFISGTTVTGVAHVLNSGQLFMSDGSVGGLTAANSGILNMSGGSDTAGLDTFDSSTTFISGSAGIQGALNAHNSSRIFISGGVIGGGVNAYDSSVVEWSGGLLFGGAAAVNIYNNATFLWSGGAITSSGPNSVIGSPIRPLTSPSTTPVPIYLHDNATLDVEGVSLSAALLDPNNSGGMFSEYQLSGYLPDGTAIPGGATFFVQNPSGGAAGAAFQFVYTGQQWTNDAGGSWGTAANWLPPVVADGAGQIADLSNAATSAPATVTLDGDRTLGSLSMQGNFAVTIAQGSGGTLTLDNQGAGASITVGNLDQILAPVVVQDNTSIQMEEFFTNGHYELGSLTLPDGITIASGKTLTTGGGTLSTAFVRGGTLTIQNGSVTIIPNGTATGASKVEGLSISVGNGAMLDLADNSLIVNNSTLDVIVPLIQSSYDSGFWDGPGITSSTAAANPGKGLAALTGAQYLALHPGAQFDGNTVALTDVLIKLANVGDADLSGTIDALDYLQIDSAFDYNADPANADNLETGWLNGDFNYDGSIDGDDYTLIDNAYNSQQSTSSDADSAGSADMIAIDTAQIAVPEPASSALFGLAGLAYMKRSRRQSPRSPVSAR